MSVTPITKNQWFKVLKVAFWLSASFVITLVPAFLTKHYTYLAAVPGVNLVLYSLSMLFQNEVTGAEAGVPANLEPVMNGVGQLTSTPAAPAPTPPVAPATPIQVTDEHGNLVTDPNAPR